MIDIRGLDENVNSPIDEAYKRAKEKEPPLTFFKSIADSIPSQVPEFDKRGWNHGSCRIVTRIDGHDLWSVENGFGSTSLNLDKFDYVVCFRQAVKNKHTGEAKGFCATVPLGFCGEVTNGQTINVPLSIPADYDPAWLEDEARKSFLKLQELVVEWHNKEA